MNVLGEPFGMEDKSVYFSKSSIKRTGGLRLRKKLAKMITMASIRQFNEKGYEATTVRDICDEVETAAPSIYYYFESKEGLYVHVLKECERAYREALEEAIRICDELNFEERLFSIYKALSFFYMENREVYDFLIRNLWNPPISLKTKIEPVRQTWVQYHENLLTDFLLKSHKNSFPSQEVSDIISGFQRLILGKIIFSKIYNSIHSSEEIKQDWTDFWNGMK